jgi:altronate hydrolase
VVGSAISPVIKVCANPETYDRMAEDMDVNAGRILRNRATLDEVGAEIFEQVCAVCAGRESLSETLGHQEFILTYKQFDPVGPACLPLAARRSA